MQPFSTERLAKIFYPSPRNEKLIGANEGIKIEFKQSFGWSSISDYFKAMASFANHDGGYIIFGIKDRPHELIGLKDEALERFQSIDNQVWSTHLRDYFSPEIIWEKKLHIYKGKSYGIVYTHTALNKPVICKKNAGELRKAAIYYRYNSQCSEIDYPELQGIIEHEKEKIHNKWMKTIKQIGDTGIARTALLDLKTGKMTGENTTLYMDESLLDEISFVQEGSFVETGGDPALIVKGQVETVVGARRVIVERDRIRAINSDDLIARFIKQDRVDVPIEYIKQICYQATGNFPVYYYMFLAHINSEETINIIDTVPNNSQAKRKLKDRLLEKKTFEYPLSTSGSHATNRKRIYRDSILDKSLEVPDDIQELKYCILSIRALEPSKIIEHKEYVLSILYNMYIKYFHDSNYEKVKPELRYAICWADEALHMELK